MARARVSLVASFVVIVAVTSACASSSPAASGAAGSAGSGGTSTGDSGGTSSSTTAGSGGTASTDIGGTTSDTGGTTSIPGGAAGAPSDTVPYANVTAVTASGSDGDYSFNVSIESSDIDCSEFADWWEVLSEDGSLLYRRILEHSHTDANGTSDADAPGNTFTRSGGPVPVTSSDVVIVRAHMSVGGYNGQVMRGTATDGFAAAPDIDANFAADVVIEDPQPTGCDF